MTPIFLPIYKFIDKVGLNDQICLAARATHTPGRDFHKFYSWNVSNTGLITEESILGIIASCEDVKFNTKEEVENSEVFKKGAFIQLTHTITEDVCLFFIATDIAGLTNENLSLVAALKADFLMRKNTIKLYENR